jgi:4-diphosphocytidyl-2-C-methyl-D-erythritol kinase
MTPARRATISAPAKINLGLEILGRRDDGYHEILTVMAAVDLKDTIHITMGVPGGPTSISGVDAVAASDNLILKAINAFAARTGTEYGYDVIVEKRIPSPGGLGGASSNAAATLSALNGIHNRPLDANDLLRLASKLGSDVPFFLGSPWAIASGTGTTLQPLPPMTAWAVIVVPKVEIEAKTARLYGALTPENMSDGRRVLQLGEKIRRGEPIPGELLGNAFSRPLYQLQSSLETTADTMRGAGASSVALSGAGPAHYALFNSPDEADRFAALMEGRVPADTAIFTAALLSAWPTLTIT